MVQITMYVFVLALSIGFSCITAVHANPSTSDVAIHESPDIRKIRKQNNKLSNLLTALEITSEDCVEEIQNLKRELFPLQFKNNEIPEDRKQLQLLQDHSGCYSGNSTADFIKLMNSSNSIILQQVNETRSQLLKLQKENADLKIQLQQKCLDRIMEFPNEVALQCNKSSWLQSMNDTVRSAVATTLEPIFHDIHQKSILANALITGIQNFTGRISTPQSPVQNRTVADKFLRLCYGKALRKTVLSKDATDSTVAAALLGSTDGIICISHYTSSPSPLGNFLVFNKTSSWMHFMGTESRNSPFIPYFPYVSSNFRIDIPVHCVKGTSAIPMELWGTTSNGDVQASRHVRTRDCFNVAWLVDDDGTVVDSGMWTDTHIWF